MIQLNNITAEYKKNNPVLKDISLNVKQSELVILIGKSGSGKSTFLKVLNGLLRPVSGTYLFQETDVYALSDNQRKKQCTQQIGFVWQNYRLISEITVEKNIMLPALIKGEKIDQKYVEEIVDLLGISQYMKQYPDKISGGEQQRVALARAMILKPQVVIADEPTGALDSKTSKQLMDLFVETKKRFGTLFFIATHDPEFTSVATREIELSDGKVIRDETKK